MTTQENKERFQLRLKDGENLEDAIKALQQFAPDVEILSHQESKSKWVDCKGLASSYERIGTTRLGQKTCLYTGWPVMVQQEHTYISNLTEPKVAPELEKYFTKVTSVGEHAHVCGSDF